NDDVIDLYNRVQVGAKVVVLPQTASPKSRHASMAPAYAPASQSRAQATLGHDTAIRPLLGFDVTDSLAGATWPGNPAMTRLRSFDKPFRTSNGTDQTNAYCSHGRRSSRRLFRCAPCGRGPRRFLHCTRHSS